MQHPSNASPSYTIQELAREAGVTPRRIRYYINKGMLPRRPGGKWFFNYDESFRVRLLAIVRLHAMGQRIAPVRAKLEDASAADVAAYAGLAPPPPPPSPPPPPAPAAVPTERATHYERWERIPLRPGLELCLRVDARAEIVQIAELIEAQFGPRAGA